MSAKIRAESARRSTRVVEGVDDEMLAQAEAMLGASSPKDAVNEALRAMVRQRMARKYIDLVAEISASAASPDADRSAAWR